MARIEQERYRMALCPYLAVGNQRMLVHLDAYGVPQSLQWPAPGAPDRLGWRDRLDEWPYWEEMLPEAICARMPYFEYGGGARDYVHEATEVEVDYIPDTNILRGRYTLPGGATLELTTFVPPDRDVWVRHYRVRGHGKLVLQSEFFEKAVRGHALAHMGNVGFRGGFDAAPRGAYVIMSTRPLAPVQSQVAVPVEGAASWTVFMALGEDIATAVALGEGVLAQGVEALEAETRAADRAWVKGARPPVAQQAFVQRNYRRWLLSNRLVTARDGAMVCGPRPFWGFAWPRDCSQQIAAFASAGFLDEARGSLQWHLENTPASGVHDARYWNDRSPMRLDNRPRQGDNPGFLAWAAAWICGACWDREWAASMAPAIYRLAEHLVEAKDEETLLPLPEADHREGVLSESMGVAATAAAGLLGSGRLAERLGDAARAKRYFARAAEIKRGAEMQLWDGEGKRFNRSVKPFDATPDIATCWAVYPLRVWEGDDPKAVQGVEDVFRARWNAGAGGVLSAPGTPYESYWMYYTTILLLGAAGIGNRSMEEKILASLERNASPQGLIPEQVSAARGNLWGCAYLPVAQAELLLYAYMPR